MRSSVMMNRINVIIRPTISGFDFPCFNQPQNAQKAIEKTGFDAQDQDIKNNKYRKRYRQK